MAKKITPRKKIAPRITKLNKAPQDSPRGEVYDDKDPRDLPRLVTAMSNFIGALCRDALGYTNESHFDTNKNGPLNLNKVYDEVLALKSDRDAWRTRCESIEAAFNTVSLGSEFAPAATPEKAQV
jgi:hypothetical protein